MGLVGSRKRKREVKKEEQIARGKLEIVGESTSRKTAYEIPTDDEILNRIAIMKMIGAEAPAYLLVAEALEWTLGMRNVPIWMQT